MEDNKVYSWEPTDTIQITGQQFNILYNSLVQFFRAPLLTPYAVLGLADAEITVRSILQQMIEKGIAIETTETEEELEPSTEQSL